MRPDSTAMTTGRLITPTLKLVREIGEGGMGTVWAAENLALGSPVAVKMLAREYADEDRSIVRFKQEAQRAARVRSPHVATVFDHGMTADGEPFIVMELLEGENLRDRIKRDGTLSLEAVKTLVGQTAKALAAAHKLGVVHRDIKPANLFIVDNEGEPFVKIVDFGIAKQMDVPPDFTTTNSMMGSPPYMSPEQYMNPKQVDMRTDLWSLGVVVYEALTGVRPFTGETGIAVAMAITRGRFKPPSEIRNDLPKALDAWMKKALDVDPEKRFGSVVEMADMLCKMKAAARRISKKIEIASLPDASGFAATMQVPPSNRPLPRGHDTTQLDVVLDQRIAQASVADLQFFEGCWKSTDTHGFYYFRIVRDQLRAAYCYNGNHALTVEFNSCQIIVLFLSS